jgi:hypothetical protein
MKTTPAICVTFKETGGRAYFGSVAAIYEAYNRDDLGITLKSLWQYKLPYENKLVRIERIEIKHKPQRNPRL